MKGGREGWVGQESSRISRRIWSALAFARQNAKPALTSWLRDRTLVAPKGIEPGFSDLDPDHLVHPHIYPRTDLENVSGTLVTGLVLSSPVERGRRAVTGKPISVTRKPLSAAGDLSAHSYPILDARGSVAITLVISAWQEIVMAVTAPEFGRCCDSMIPH
jgi:hypothetical protein